MECQQHSAGTWGCQDPAAAHSGSATADGTTQPPAKQNFLCIDTTLQPEQTVSLRVLSTAQKSVVIAPVKNTTAHHGEALWKSIPSPGSSMPSAGQARSWIHDCQQPCIAPAFPSPAGLAQPAWIPGLQMQMQSSGRVLLWKAQSQDRLIPTLTAQSAAETPSNLPLFCTQLRKSRARYLTVPGLKGPSDLQ